MSFQSRILWIAFLTFSQALALWNMRRQKRHSSWKAWGESTDDGVQVASSKHIVFLRHGRTYMNDYIGGVHFGSPNFSDVFPDTPENKRMFYDSPLTAKGVEQAQALNLMLKSSKDFKDCCAGEIKGESVYRSLLDDIDLVIVSPLTRALQTLDIGLYPLLENRGIPIIAVPLASERLYLVSDIGVTRNELKALYEYVDFDSSILSDGSWHFEPTEEMKTSYVEWRPSGEGQVYACLGEPQDYFDRRMSELYRLLEQRSEQTIVVVSHAGVIDWFLQETFENCELRVVDFDELKPRALNKEEGGE